MPETAAASPTVRLLPTAEWHRLADVYPFSEGGLPDPDHWRIVVAEIDGAIVGHTMLYDAVHLDVWIAPAQRHHAHLFQALWAETRRTLVDHQVGAVFATVPNDLPQQQRLVERFGFVPADAQLYLLHVPDTTED